ncbi:MAG: M28 family peptidase [Candidatus Aminicenantes bacterium]|nr:M28 family peptidase [Candidatus Aminicenantes bacterium]
MGRSLEKQFDSYLSPADLRARLKRLSAHPHHVGSPYDKENAEFILSQYKTWGFDARIEEFSALFPTPKTRLLEMTAPVKYTAVLKEPPLKEDSTSNKVVEQLATYNAYSIDGDVTGDLIYVNYGIPSDYDELERMGIDVQGKIVITRYGGSWRGIKPKVAAEHGAIGCLIYSDPKDDGFYVGDVYPKGAWRNEFGVQRGSVAEMPVYPGDPSTPFIGATPGVKRLPLNEIKVLTKIPVLPISYHDALPLLQSLTGPVAPDHWKGALPVTYHVGPGPAKVHLKLAFSWDIKPIYDVIAMIQGSTYPDQWIIRGNHHDAWVNGAEDPLSGQVATMEEGKALGELVKSGWKPKRTIVYCAWDGEEPGLIGSTEWVETHADELRQKAVAYINSDSNERGFVYMDGSQTLQHFINDVARDVLDPEKNISVWERARAVRLLESSPGEKKDIRSATDLKIGALGSGSDFTPFLQHIGIASLNIGYGGESEGGGYHSIYDSFDHFMRFGDPTFAYGVALAQTGGHAVLRLADADILPFDFSDFAAVVAGYLGEIKDLTQNMREETLELNRELEENVFTEVANPAKTYRAPKAKDPVPYLNFAPLENAVSTLRKSAEEYQNAKRELEESGRKLAGDRPMRLNEIVFRTERALTNPEGLKGRPWFIHEIYAPGFYTGYSVKTLPSVREAIEQRQWEEADQQVIVVADTLEAYSGEIRKATAILRSASK